MTSADEKSSNSGCGAMPLGGNYAIIRGMRSIPRETELKSYGEDVFSERAVRASLPKRVADKLLATMRESRPLDPTIADAVAEGMKKWAIARGATHFTHWFQPLTGGTAEKHNSFL